MKHPTLQPVCEIVAVGGRQRNKNIGFHGKEEVLKRGGDLCTAKDPCTLVYVCIGKLLILLHVCRVPS